MSYPLLAVGVLTIRWIGYHAIDALNLWQYLQAISTRQPRIAYLRPIRHSPFPHKQRTRRMVAARERVNLDQCPPVAFHGVSPRPHTFPHILCSRGSAARNPQQIGGPLCLAVFGLNGETSHPSCQRTFGLPDQILRHLPSLVDR